MLRAKEVKTLYDSMSAKVGTSSMAELEREVIPILTKLVRMRSMNKKHPVVKKLYKWLMDPRRTGQDFFYVVGPLMKYVMDTLCKTHLIRNNSYDLFVAMIAAEVLAKKCPVLDGTWELAAWILVKVITTVAKDECDVVFSCFST